MFDETNDVDSEGNVRATATDSPVDSVVCVALILIGAVAGLISGCRSRVRGLGILWGVAACNLHSTST